MRLHSSGLPEADDIALCVFEVGCEAHVRDWLFLLDGLAAYVLDALEGFYLDKVAFEKNWMTRKF